MSVPASVYNSCIAIEDALEGVVLRLEALDNKVQNPVSGISPSDQALISKSYKDAEDALYNLREFMNNNDIPTVD